MMAQTHPKIRRDLHWGYWFIADDGKVRDEEGNTWRSLPEAYWASINMLNQVSLPVESERLLRMLHAVNGRGGLGSLDVELQLTGSLKLRDFYRSWLWSIGLVIGSSKSAGYGFERLSDLGHSVLLMLELTRDEKFRALSSEDFAAVLEASCRNVVIAQDVLTNMEHKVANWPHFAARAKMGHRHIVQLVSFDAENARRSRVCMREVVWTLSFDSPLDRDVFFAWMCCQSEHWPQWGSIASHRGAGALTDILLRSFAISHLNNMPAWPASAEGGKR